MTDGVPSSLYIYGVYDRILTKCQVRSRVGQSRPEWSEITLEWVGFDNKIGTTLASACALCLDLLSRMRLHISEGWNCCQDC